MEEEKICDQCESQAEKKFRQFSTLQPVKDDDSIMVDVVYDFYLCSNCEKAVNLMGYYTPKALLSK